MNTYKYQVLLNDTNAQISPTRKHRRTLTRYRTECLELLTDAWKFIKSADYYKIVEATEIVGSRRIVRTSFDHRKLILSQV